jgi:phosphoribosylamine--glycine ligase
MIIGVIGSGGREHAICHALNKSKKINKIYCFPGNAGTAKIGTNVNIDVDNFNKLSSRSRKASSGRYSGFF